MKERILRYGAISLATVGLASGLAAASSVEFDTTGPESDNKVEIEHDNDVDLDNDNDVDVDNDVDQDADSGDASVKYNTNGEDAESGDAENDSSVDTTVDVTNGGLGDLCDCLGFGGSDHDVVFDTTGPKSDNEVEIKTSNDIDVNNDNDVDVDNDVDQDADSGDAYVGGNTNGGGAVSGAARNTSSVSTSVSISN
jgi:hypothetical protein